MGTLNFTMAAGVSIERKKIGGGHFYKVTGDPKWEGKRLPSTTTVLGIINKPGLNNFFKKNTIKVLMDELDKKHGLTVSLTMVDNLRKDAMALVNQRSNGPADFGTEVHELIERNLYEKDYPVMTEEMTKCIQHFEDWKHDQRMQISISEYMVYSTTFGYGCTIDAVGWREGENIPIIIDWKTGRLYPEQELQIAANAQAWFESTGIEVKEGYIVQISPNEDSYKEIRVDIAERFPLFLHAKGLWEGLKNLEKEWKNG